MAILGFTVKIDGKELAEQQIRTNNIVLSQPLWGHHRITMECVSLAAQGYRDGNRDSGFDTLRESLGKDLEFDAQMDMDGGKVSFQGLVTSVQVASDHLHGLSLIVEGHSSSIKMDGAPHNQLWVESTAADIIKTIAGNYGGLCQVDAPAKQEFPITVQHNESDYAFIQRLCQQEQFWVCNEGNKLKIGGAPSDGGTAMSVMSGGEGACMRLAIKQGTAPGKFSASAWDRAGKKRLEQASDAKALKSLSANAEAAVKASDLMFSESGNHSLERTPFDLKGMESDLESLRSSWAGGLVQAEGESYNASLTPGQKIDIDGLAIMDNGPYILTGVNHYFQASDTNYRNEFTAVPEGSVFPPQKFQRPHSPSLWGGVVMDTSDPDALGRVKVKLHHSVGTASGDPTMPWIRVGQGHSGQSWGSFVLPEIEDEVIVAALGSNPEELIVISSVPQGQSSGDMGPLQVAQDAVGEQDAAQGMAKVFVTKSGNQILIVDSDGAETIEISSPGAQNQIRLTLDGDPRIEVTSQGEIAIEAEGDVNLTAKGAIKMESDADISLIAKGKIELKSTGDMMLDSKGNADLKAGMNATIKGMQAVLDGSGKVTCNPVGVEIKGTLVRIN